MKKYCYIVGAGDFINKYLPVDTDFVIAADGGLAFLESHSIKPDMIIGDFDSLNRIPEGDNVIKLPVEKDDTDTAVAINYGERLGCDTFIINGGTGGRLDHTLANIQLLISLAKNKKHGYLIEKNCIITAICNDKLMFTDDVSDELSVFCFDGEAHGVCEHGTKYEVENVSLYSHKPLGVSNCVIEKNAFVSVKDGCLVITFNADLRKMAELN